MTKDEKFQNALEKWVNANKESKNCVVTKTYSDGNLLMEYWQHIDIYSPIIYKYKPEWLVSDYLLLVGKHDDNENLILCLQNSEKTIFVTPNPISGFGDIEQISIECIPEEMLDEILAIEDFEPIGTIKVPDPYAKSKINPHGEYKKIARKRRLEYIIFFLSLIALVVSLTALIIKLC